MVSVFIKICHEDIAAKALRDSYPKSDGEISTARKEGNAGQ